MAVKPFDFTKSATKKTTGATSGRTSQIPTLSVLAGTAVQQVTVLPIALLDAHPEQAHYHMDESKLEGLRDSIREKGVLQPICVRAKADGRYEILAGHQRVEASRRVQLQTIPAMVYSGLDDDAATYIFHATNAYGRDGLLPSEKAYAYAEIERVLKKNINGMKTTQAIADETGESTRTIQRYKKLLELSEPLVKMVDNGRISLRAAGVLADLNVNAEVYACVKELARASGIPVKKEQLPSISLHGYYSPSENAITINSNLEDTKAAVTLCHEYAHGLLHRTSTQSEAICEFEAQSLALMLMARYGLPQDDSEIGYMKTYLERANNDKNFSLDTSLERLQKQLKFVDERISLIAEHRQTEFAQTRAQAREPGKGKQVSENFRVGL